MSTQPGPRDWLPSSCGPVRPRALLVDRAAPNHALQAAGLSAFFGLVALTMAVSPLVPGMTSYRWIISTVGVTGILWGVRATRRRDGRAAIATSLLTTLGMGTGGIATVVMIGMLVAASSGAFTNAPVAQAARPDVAVHAPAAVEPPAPTPKARLRPPSAGLMEETAGTFAYRMKQLNPDGRRWPAAIDVSESGVVSLPGIGIVVQIPLGAAIGYRIAPDGSAFAIRISDRSDPARYVDYDSNRGAVAPSAALRAAPVA